MVLFGGGGDQRAGTKTMVSFGGGGDQRAAWYQDYGISSLVRGRGGIRGLHGTKTMV